MADPIWVSIGSLTASSFSALAAYLAIRQTVKQRRISNKVQLITKNKRFIIYHDGFDKPIPLSKPTEQFETAIPIINAGLGPAIKLEYEWVFDYKMALSEINISKAQPKDITNDYTNSVYKNKHLYTMDEFREEKMITIYGFGDVKPYILKNKYDDENYILPYSVEKNESNIPFPSIILMILIQKILNKGQVFDELFHPVSGPSIIIRYEDVTGVKEKIVFKTNITLEKVNFGGGKPLHEMCFCMTYSHPNTWAWLIPERIRKWSARLRK